MAKHLDLVGKKFGILTPIEPTSERQDRKVVWVCRCDCGNITKVQYKKMTSGNTKSCGCLKLDMLIKRSTKHGAITEGNHSSTYNIWHNMKSRCRNEKHPMFRYYGGRGISYCERWENYQNFLEDMGERPGALTLQRIDNDSGYGPSNCKWATMKEQCTNRRPRNSCGIHA